MAIFGKDERMSDPRALAADAVLSIISGGIHVVGDVEGPGLLKIDGRVDGSITGLRQVILGREGTIVGNVSATEVILAGAVEGSVTATDRLEVQGTASVSGDIQTRLIVVHEGARLNGLVRMGTGLAVEENDRPAVQVLR